MIIKTQATKKETPPSGVMAPRTLICVTLRTNRLPENRIIPINMSQPDQLISGLEIFPANKPSTNKPTAWNI